jgi:hypothetical protein
MKKKLTRQIIELICRQEREPFLDTKIQNTFAGMRGHLASIEKRLGILEAALLTTMPKRPRRSNVIPMKRRRV